MQSVYPHGEGNVFSTDGAGATGYRVEKKNLDPPTPYHIQTRNSRCMTDLKVKAKTRKLLEENIAEKYALLRGRQSF